MAKNKYLKQTFPIKCKGRDYLGRECLTEPVDVEVKVYQRPGDETSISILVDCPHAGGGHSDHCLASDLGKNPCPFAIDLPSGMDSMIGKVL